MKPEAKGGLMAEFVHPATLLKAVESAYTTGYRRMDAFTPYPVEGLAIAMGKGGSWLPAFMLAAALAGGAAGFLMQWLAMASLYPINVGGRPLLSWPAFIPVTFELTILAGALTGVAALFVLTRLPRLHHPVFSVEGFERATSDRFFLWVQDDDPLFDPIKTKAFLESQFPSRIIAISDQEVAS